MSISLQSADVRHETRIRLLFTNTLAAGAFGVPAPAFYRLESLDGKGASPGVAAALLVPGQPCVVELVLDTPLVKGASYKLVAENVPATDSSTTESGTSIRLQWGTTSPKENVEPAARDRDLLLYGVDLLWTGSDFQETPTGDLERVSGTANVTKALNRGIESNGLPWDPNWGAGARDFVDSPSVAAGTLKGAVSAQILRDPRVRSVKVTYEIDEEVTFLHAEPTLVSGETIERVSIEVPNEI